ncbi:peptidoglycan DD-metalloendopeptidase family protein [Zoogloea sp.]|uniref:M23 family metallopeptidase n=1 Tax=Zoogloea sp. TaxID=49181 RepID=UPI0035B3653F
MDISASVGAWERGAHNLKADVITVQTLLAGAARRLGKSALDPQGIDGGIARPPKDSATVAAIKAFQLLSGLAPTGLIAVQSQDWQHLLMAAGGVDGAGVASEESFPLATLPKMDWTQAPRAYGSNRSSGARAHAGCDLYAPIGTSIHAVRAGVVVRDPYAFYAETDALEIDHGDFLIRYGEIQPGSPLRKGDRVIAGQFIAKVGRLVGVSVPSAMLHLEMYSGKADGRLTVAEDVSARRADGVPFLRRADLIDPTPYLDKWKQNLPKA